MKNKNWLAVLCVIGIAAGLSWLVKNNPSRVDAPSRPTLGTESSEMTGAAGASGDELTTPSQKQPGAVLSADARATEAGRQDSDESESAMTETLPEKREEGEVSDDDPVTVMGTVVDALGDAVAGASVALFSWRSGFGLPEEYIAPYVTESSAESGQFQFVNVPYFGAGSVTVTSDGYQTARTAVAPGPGESETVKITLKTGVTLQGRVLTQSGAPVADALVRATGLALEALTASRGQGLPSAVTAATDEEGYFMMGFEAVTAAGFTVRSREYGTTSFSNVQLDDSYYVLLVLEPAAALTGRIAWKSGASAAGITVSLEGSVAVEVSAGGNRQAVARIATSGSEYAAVTNGEGRYAIEGIDVGQEYTANLSDAEGRPRVRQQPIGVFRPGETRVWDHFIQQAIRVYGHVYGEQTGAPIVNARVISMPSGTIATVDEDGRYEIELLTGAGTYTFVPNHGGGTGFTLGNRDMKYQVEADLVDGEERELDLTLFDAAEWTIHVTDGLGAPLPGATVFIQEVEPGASPNRRRLPDSTDEDGQVVAHDLTPGVLSWAVAHHGGFVPGESETVVAEPNATMEDGFVVLYPGGGLGARLTVEGGAIGEGPVFVAVRSPEGKVSYWPSEAGGDGAVFVDHNFSPGRLEVAVRWTPAAGETLGWFSDEVESVPGEMLDLGEIALRPLVDPNDLLAPGAGDREEEEIVIRRVSPE